MAEHVRERDMHLGSHPCGVWISKEVSGHRPACLKVYQWGVGFMSLHIKAFIRLSLNAFSTLETVSAHTAICFNIVFF